MSDAVPEIPEQGEVPVTSHMSTVQSSTVQSAEVSQNLLPSSTLVLPPVPKTGSIRITKINKLVLDGFKSFGKRAELLFGENFNAILGSNGSGKCVTGDTLVTLADGATVRIDELVNAHLRKPAVLDDGFVAEGSGVKILSLGKDLRVHSREIQAFVKRTTPEILLQIQTRSGRKITATPYHPLFILKGEEVVPIRADELREGVRIAVPRELPVTSSSSTFIELLDHITEDDLMYVPWSLCLDQLIRQKKQCRLWHAIASRAGIHPDFLKSFFAKQAINFAHLVKLLRFLKYSDKVIMQHISVVKAKTTNICCKMPWKNTPELARVLGYLLSEGRFPPDSCQIWFTNGTPEIVQDYYHCLTSVFGIRATINEYKANVWDVLAYSEPARVILQKLGMAVGGTIHKKIASLFFQHAREREISALLNGLYCGDGYISPSSIEITTKSPALASAIETALLRLGILSRTKKTLKVATNSGFSGWYDTVYICGIEQFSTFARHIQLVHNAKRERVTQLLGKKANPNVDLIEVNELVRQACKEQYISVKPVSKQYPRLGSYVHHGCLPSRSGVQHLLEGVLQQDSPATCTLSKLAFSSIFWDEIVSVQEIIPRDPWVYDLCVAEDHNFVANNVFVHNSNILDSLCFVLGKRSSKDLRAEKASNLIYNGGKVKNPAKEAEVSIYFDNANNVFPIPEDEVKVSRIVKHDGQSKYKINNKTTTRQEVLDLLGSAKINPDGYNIILQGDVIRLVEMSPIDRRMIIEEIAGISVYEEKKQQALNDLTKVDEKLKEADIILKEREGYLKDLKKDRDQALKHKQLADNLKTNRASLLKRAIDKKTIEQQALEKKTSTYRQNLERINTRIQNLRQDLTARRERIKFISADIERQGEVEQVRRQKELETVRVEIATLKAQANSLTTELARVDQRKKQLSATCDEIEQKKENARQESTSVQNSLNISTETLQHIQKTLVAFKQKHGLGEHSAGVEHEITTLDSQADELQKDLQHCRENQQNLVREKDKIEFQLQTIDQQIAKTQQLEQANASEISLLKKKKDQFKKLILELNELLNTDSKQAAELAHARQRVVQLRDEAAKLEIKNSSAQAAQAENIAVKKVLENRNQLGEIYGTIADLGQVDQKYATALEVAAAQKLQSIVVEDDVTAATAIKFLKKAQLGIATFLPLNKIKPFAAKEDAKKMLKEKGVYGLAIDLVEFDPKFRAVFSHVFGSTLVVDSIDVARSLGIGSMRMVTLDGDLAEHTGAMIGGYRHKRAASFKEKGLGDKLTDKYTEIQELETKISRLETSRQQNDDQITTMRELKANLEGDIITTEKTLHITTGDLDADEQYKQELKTKDCELDLKLGKLQDQLVEKTQLITQLKTKKQQLRDSLAELNNPRVLAELNAYEQQHKQTSEDLVRQQTELKNLEQKHKELEQEHTNATNLVAELANEHVTHQQQRAQLEKKRTEQEAIAHIKDTELQQFYAQFKTLFEERNKLSDFVVQLENQTFTQEEAARKEEFTLNTFAVQEAALKAELASYIANFEQYAGIEVNTEKTEIQLTKEIVECEQLMASIGSVNLRALDIYDAAEHEYKTLTEKKGVLVTEKDAVLHFMNEIETRKTELFMVALNAVSQNFQQNFSTLSPKGVAQLELEQPDAPFEAGLCIKVKITGEKALDIRSLSGGEKTLTALAFLFAIQDHDPAPFYVLDEVDAALDKTNSEKLSKLIRKYTDRAQYVVISHNDALLTEADTLYGVSMNEHGISQVVSVRA